jgi:hypothetical protein
LRARGKEAAMHPRERRRDRTVRYGERARREHLRVVHSTGAVDCVCEQSVWFFAKRKSLGCGCRRVGRRTGPKVVYGGCHDGIGGYHPCVRQRIDGKRLCQQWLGGLRSRIAADDIEL